MPEVAGAKDARFTRAIFLGVDSSSLVPPLFWESDMARIVRHAVQM
jgi:hypothetical protein